jgi:hypothetical protein
VNVSSSAESFNVDFVVVDVDAVNLTVGALPIDPAGEAEIDATAPTLDPNAVPASVTYDKGTKVLTMTFKDGNVTPPRVNVIDRDDGDVEWKVDLSKLRIQDEIDGSEISLVGAKFLYDDYVSGPTDDYEIPSTDLTAADEARADTNVVKIKLTSAQSADFENKFPTVEVGGEMKYKNENREAELDILAGALMDHVFDNQIAEDLDNRISPTAVDTVPPKLLPAVDKPIKLNAETRELTLKFDEAIYGRGVDLSKIYIMNYEIVDEEETVAGEDILVEKVRIATDFVTDLRNARVLTEDYVTTLVLRLTTDQRDVLKGDHPQLYLAEGAVKDVADNPNDSLNNDGMDNDGVGVDEGGSLDDIPITDFIDSIADIELAVDESDDDYVDAANVYVTPAFLSGVETVYDGDMFD